MIVVNSIITPDGTRLISKHRHDFVIHKDNNGKTYGVDGGLDYLKRIEETGYKDASIYFDNIDTHFEEIRKYFFRGNRGKNFDQELKFIPLKDISDDWLNNIIIYINETNCGKKYLDLYEKEVKYRKDNNITVEEN